jgi:hypothetical protein
MMKSRLAFGMALLVAVCAAFGFAQQQDKVKLEHKRKKGDKLMRTSASSAPFLMQVSGTGFNMTYDGTLETSAEETEEVTDVSDGVIAIKRTGKETSKIMGGPAPAEETREFKPTTYRFAPTGKLVSADAEAFASKKMGVEAVGDVISYITDQIPFLMEFPDRELSVGEEWTNTHTVKSPDGNELKVTTKHRLFGLEPANKRAWIASEAHVPFEVNGGPGLSGFKLTGVSQARTHTLFSYSDGKIVKSNETIHFDITVEAPTMGVNLTIKLVAHGTATTNAQ